MPDIKQVWNVTERSQLLPLLCGVLPRLRMSIHFYLWQVSYKETVTDSLGMQNY